MTPKARGSFFDREGDGDPGRTPGPDKPAKCHARLSARRGDGKPVQGTSSLHQGQRSFAPRRQAGYMTAPDQNASTVKIILATGGSSTHDIFIGRPQVIVAYFKL